MMSESSAIILIISVGYRVNSHRGVQFRIWATKTLGEYVVKGFVVDANSQYPFHISRLYF
jgi:hypothetical protein